MIQNGKKAKRVKSSAPFILSTKIDGGPNQIRKKLRGSGGTKKKIRKIVQNAKDISALDMSVIKEQNEDLENATIGILEDSQVDIYYGSEECSQEQSIFEEESSYEEESGEED